MVLIQKMYQNRGKGSTLFSNERSKKKKTCIFFEQTFDLREKMLCISNILHTFAAENGIIMNFELR